MSEKIRFKCQKCGKCCGAEVIVSYADVYRLTEDENIREEILKKHQPREAKGNLVYSTNSLMGLKEKYPCCFLKDNKCSVYELRPQICRIYPFLVLPEGVKPKRPYKIIATRKTIEEGIFHLAIIGLNCPGLGVGEEVNIDKLFEIGLEEYENFKDTYQDMLLSEIAASAESFMNNIKQIQDT
ncbi:MAG: YkgJ family cysteine cluster protein [Candidatus Odinarchaeum yellowstonii]|uniref:YkgJ family cysteine cluster protein n=1 Tax=Odinarchaeota yellowstonii (strain LCB_4) TaxID=1841599 RepID=A0AAF0IAM8_ODILC|nr:MAG: YkgJ family cysteine cluster protein [Candidatus Odinarchaeum yellowstonii]